MPDPHTSAPEPSDISLMAALRAGDDRALNELMDRWRGKVAAYLLRVTGSHDTAMDLTQEVFVRVYQSRERYRPSAAFSTWLFTIATNLARNHARWRARHPTVSLDAPGAAGEDSPAPRHETTDPGPTPAASAITTETLRSIETAFAALPQELREAMSLFIFQDLGYAEIAAITGGTPKAVETRIYRARQKLKETLAGLRSAQKA